MTENDHIELVRSALELVDDAYLLRQALSDLQHDIFLLRQDIFECSEMFAEMNEEIEHFVNVIVRS